MQYTTKERTEKKITVGFIRAQAKSILEKDGVFSVCNNTVPKNPDALFTVEEADKIIISIVDESLYFAGRL